MSIKYQFLEVDGLPTIKSDSVFDDLDMLELLGSDLSSIKDVHRFKDKMKSKETWWSNATKVEFCANHAHLKTSFEWGGAETILTYETLNQIISGWDRFLSKYN